MIFKVEERLPLSDTFLEDYCDGKDFQTHPVFSVDSGALQIMAYFDEVEVCNPLRSHSIVHKVGKRHLYLHRTYWIKSNVCTVGVFMYSLGNIHPKHRSQLKTLQIFALVETPILNRYGFQKILHRFVHDMNELSSV